MSASSSVDTAVVLLSGGLDSSTAAYLADASGYDILALSFDYGQRHDRELESARRVASALRVAEHRVITIDLASWGHSSLTGHGEIPQDGSQGAIPSTWVPARNLIFLSIASGYAETMGASAIYVGVSQVDYSGYPDCRREFVEAYQRAANQSSRNYVEYGMQITVVAPFLDMPKAGIIRLGLRLGLDYGLTWSCYLGGDRPCETCDSCRLRAAAFESAGVGDPLLADNA
jgi:7-cyano-7-deazaguanine synthase